MEPGTEIEVRIALGGIFTGNSMPAVWVPGTVTKAGKRWLTVEISSDPPASVKVERKGADWRAKLREVK